MFSELLDKLNSFQDHHQVFFAIFVMFGLVIFSWGIERILEEHIFIRKTKTNYLIAVSIGIIIMWLTKHIILKVM